MALVFKSDTFRFDQTSGGPQREVKTYTFNRVRQAEAALKGFNIEFTNGDHHLLREEVDIDVKIVNSNTVEVAVDFVLRDGSGHYDDPYRGSVDVLILAQVG